MDANVLFTAAITPSGVSRALVETSRRGLCRAHTSRFAADEALRNIALKAPEREADFDSLLTSVAVVAEADARLSAWARSVVAAKDAPILAAAVAARSDLLITGDRRHFGAHFGSRLHGVRVEPSREALRAILVNHRS